MASIPDKKLFLGARLKRLRRELDITQARMAEELGVSASYLNLLERNQRPVTAQVLLRLADAYDLDLRTISNDGDAAGAQGLEEVFADQLFKDLRPARHEIAELVEHAPVASEAIVRLYRAYVEGRRMADVGGYQRPEDTGLSAIMGASDWVRDFIQGHRNYFPELDEAGEAYYETLNPAPQDFANAARARLMERFGVKVTIAPVDLLADSVRRYDLHRKRLFLSEVLTGSGRTFALAYQLVVLEHSALIEAHVERASPPDASTRNLVRVALANYLAAATIMPYAAFRAALEKLSYDIELVRARFGVSYEQACHRITTLARPGARGLPFFMIRVDAAGNISKRYANSAFPFSRFAGACPRWNIHSTFRTPGRIVTQIVETVEGERYFTLSRTVKRVSSPHAGEDSELAIGLGCELKHAAQLVYAKGLDLVNPLATPVGPACRICERPNCTQRAAEPLGRSLTVDNYSKSVSPYPFESF
jgi:predicted transcriptional regulator/transcriptional regulator with XRE-family HTH domain